MIINNFITQKLISKIKNSPNYSIGDFLELSTNEQEVYDKYIQLLNNQYPLDYIIGHIDINGIRFFVEEDVFIPRPCTEELINKIVSNDDLIIDICAGTGLIGLSIAKLNNSKKVILIEKSKLAYESILKTIKHNSITNVKVILDDALTHDYSQYHNYTVICNPPYVPESSIYSSVRYEPKDAIYSGIDGLTFFDKLLTMLSTNLPNQIYFELDPDNINQAQVKLNQYYKTDIIQDLDGFQRFLIGNLR